MIVCSSRAVFWALSFVLHCCCIHYTADVPSTLLCIFWDEKILIFAFPPTMVEEICWFPTRKACKPLKSYETNFSDWIAVTIDEEGWFAGHQLRFVTLRSSNKGTRQNSPNFVSLYAQRVFERRKQMRKAFSPSKISHHVKTQIGST